MLNKRLLIQSILSHNDEGSLYDRKESIDLTTSDGRSKLLKHICALSNSNPFNESFLIVGVTNENVFIGCKFVDDSKIQDLVRSYLRNPPIVKYENIMFPGLEKDSSIGLLTIYNNALVTSFLQGIERIKPDSIYCRLGSKSVPVENPNDIIVNMGNAKIVESTVRYSYNTLSNLIGGVFNFFSEWDKAYNPRYIVFKDQFVLCWRGWEHKGIGFYSEVDIQIINEEVRLFYSANREVKITITEQEFRIDEYVFMGFESNYDYYPLESTSILFEDNGTYKIVHDFIFKRPIFPRDEIEELYLKRKKEAAEILRIGRDSTDLVFSEGIAMDFFICFLNGIAEAKADFDLSWEYVDGASAQLHRLCQRVFEMMEQSSPTGGR